MYILNVYFFFKVEKLNLQALATSRGKPLASSEFKTAVGEIICKLFLVHTLFLYKWNAI